ncbi:MAG TPA: hypothetical protein VNR40_07870, partial [Steroidobacter sp.]|nr:hypothetical protein [Steroidobacter sp.]
MKATGRAWLCMCSLLSGAAANPVLAQGADKLLEEIVVTAQKRSESLQEVPIAVTAMTAETRDLLGVISIGELTDFTPGLSYATTLDRMSLRGVG